MPKKTEQRYAIFAREWVRTLNATKAAIAAGYSKKWAKVAGSELQTKPNVLALVEKLRAKQIEKYEVSMECVVRELSLLGFANMADYLTPSEDGTLVLDFSKLTREQAAAIQERSYLVAKIWKAALRP